MTENNNQKFVEFVKSILRKIKPRFSFHYVAYTTLFFLVIFSAIQLVSATTPNPGHPWAEVGDGTFVVTGPSLSRTYTFPDANATILTTNNTVTVAQGGTGQTSIAAGSVWAANSADTLSAITSATGTKILTNTAGTITWEVPASGMIWPAGGAGIPNYSGSSSWGTSYTTNGSGTVVALITSPSFTTPSLGVATATSVDFGTTTLLGSRALTVDTGGVFNVDLSSAAGDDFTIDTDKLVVEGDTGNVGIGLTAPTARLHLTAGTATAGTAPLKFTSGTNLTAAEAGAMEWNGTNLFITQTSGPTRKTLAYTTDIPAASPITIVNSSNLFSTGLYGTGSGVTTTDGSIFLGTSAGDTATSASYSNFLGSNAGYTATSASYSNFLGSNAGYGATNASDSNFLGQNAGQNATLASYSNFLGLSAGNGATNASNSNFFGQASGDGATDAPYSNFFGSNAGYNATVASYSNFLGLNAGSSNTLASASNNSNFLGQNAGQNAVSADNSNFLGQNAGYAATTAASSNFLGQNAGFQATSAFNSNFIGSSAGNSATSASYSNFIGSSAGYDAASATYSNFLGYSAGDSAVNASYSNIIGYKAGKWYSGNQIGSNNIIIGTNISLPNTTANAINLGGVLFATGTYATTSGNPSITAVSGGKVGIGVVSPNNTLQVANLINFNDTDFNTLIGKNAGANIVTGAQHNTFLGYETGKSAAAGGTNVADYNTAIGDNAFWSNTSGANNTAIGASAINANTTGTANTAIGVSSLLYNTTGGNNAAIGYQSLVFNTTGNNNTAIGNNSLLSNKTNNRSTAVGYGAMYYADNRTPTGRDTFNTAVGAEALKGSSTAANNTGQYNTAIGDSSLFGITSGNYNTALGYQSLYTNTTGGSNTALGMGALYSSTTGDNNVSIGLYSLYNNKANSRSIAIGTNAMYYADDRTSGRVTYNTAIGYEALKGGVTAANNIGQYNTTIGDSSLSANTSGEKNAVIGANALTNNTTGYYNVALGYNAGRYINAGTANATSNSSIYLGYDTRASADGNANEIVIGTSAIGNGSNTATIGNTSLLRTYLTGVNLKAGSATAGTAPLKFTAGTNLTAAEAGAMEWDGTNLFITQTTGPTRKTIAYTSDITAQVYPGAGIANSTGSSWGTSYTTTGSGSIIALQTSPAFVTSVTGDATFSAFNTTTTNLSIGGAATTLTIGGTPTTAITHNYSTNATAASTTKTVNLGTGGVISSTTNINIGSGYGGITNIKSPTLLVGDSFSSSSLISTPSSSGYAYSLKIAGQSGIDSDGNVYIYGGNTAGMGGGSVFLGHDGASSVGKVFIGNAYNIARLSLPAGTATTGMAPLKFTSGTNLTTAEAGAMEWDGTNLFITQTSGPTRKTIAYTSDITPTAWDAIGDPAGNGAIAFGSTVQTMDWATATTTNPLTLNAPALTTGNLLSLASNTLTSGALLNITSAGTGALTNQKGLNIALSGTNGTSAQTTYGAYISNTHAGTTSTNVGLYSTASGGTTANYAAIFDQGNVGIGTTTPTSKLDITTNSLGVTQTTSSGLALVNTTAAAAGAQQISPALRFTSQGWEIMDPSSMPVDFRIFSVPVQGVIAPSGYLTFQSVVGGGSYNNAMVITTGNSVGIGGDLTPDSMFSVGTTSQFQVNSTGAIAAIAGYTQSSGVMSLTSANTTQTDTSSAFAGNFNSLTTGTGMNLASSSLSSGSLVNLAVTGTAAVSNTQKVLNITNSGANAASVQTTYGGYFANTRTGTISTNVGLYSTATGATNNYAAIFDQGNVGIGTTTPSEKLDVNGNINIPTTSSTVGIIKQNGTAIFHSYGTENFFLGVSAGNYTLTGQQNTAIGKQAMLNLTSGSYNTAVGYQALYNANSSENAAFGRMALMYANGANNNTAVGNTALGGVSLTGSYNVGIGKDAGRTISSGAHNVFIGYAAGYNGSQLATATNSMALGDRAYTTASNQVVIGASTVTQTLLNGNIGIGTTTTTNIISISGTAAQTIWMERNATAATAGQGLTLSSGGAISGTADLAGGDLNLKSGISTGTGSSAMRFFTATAGTTGVSDRTPTEKMTILGSGNVGIGDTTPDGTLDIDSSVTTGVNFGITNTGVYTGTGLLSVVADSATTGVVGLMTANGLSSGSILSLTSAGTAALTNQKGLNIALSGTNGTAAQTTYGAYISNTHAGTTSTNVGLYATASGGTTANYSAILVGNMQITGNILPSADDTYTLGSDSYRFSDLFLGPQTLHIGTSTSDEGYISYTTSTNVLKIESIGDLVLQQYVGGMVGIGTGTPSTILDLGSFDNGTLAGPVITLGINNNVTTPAAGAVNFKNNLAVDGYVWQDAGGYLRIFDRQPTAARDTDGTVVGDQTSTRETKQDINDYTDYDMAFSMVINAPLHTFRYKKEVSGYGVDSPLAKERIGFIADEVNQMFMWGNSIDQVSVNGLLMASIKAMDLKIVNINDLEIENTWRDSLIAWLANAENHIARIFTGEICLTEPGQEAVCINRTELQSLKALLIETNTNQGNGNGGVTTEPQATCSDGILNQDETEIDIGGICNSNSTIIPESVEPIITTTNSEPEPTPEIIQNPETATN